ncbi:aspartic peptidase domain-containing protein [Scleroderma yunnanense]
MPSFPAITSIVLCATLAHALFELPVTKIERSGSYLKGSPDANRARVRRMMAGLPATNLDYTIYTASIGIGHPVTHYNLVLDTGSSNTVCGANKKYVRTKTSIPTGQNVSEQFGAGSFQGIEYLDRVTLAPNLVITNQSIANAITWTGFEGVHGILGLGPAILTQGSLSPGVDSIIPTVMDNAMSQGLLQHDVFAISFAPTTEENETNGAITYGGTDPSKYTGDITYIPLTTTSPSSIFWGINVTSVSYGEVEVIPQSTAGVIDSGTTQILLADDFFAAYMKAIPGAHLDAKTGLLEIPRSSIPKMHSLHFNIGGSSFSLDVRAQLVPASQNMAWGGHTSKYYGIVGQIGNYSGAGFDFILGLSFMERFYAVFDAERGRVGLAYT